MITQSKSTFQQWKVSMGKGISEAKEGRRLTGMADHNIPQAALQAELSSPCCSCRLGEMWKIAALH